MLCNLDCEIVRHYPYVVHTNFQYISENTARISTATAILFYGYCVLHKFTKFNCTLEYNTLQAHQYGLHI